MDTVVIKYKANRAFVKLKLFIFKLVYIYCILYNIYLSLKEFQDKEGYVEVRSISNSKSSM